MLYAAITVALITALLPLPRPSTPMGPHPLLDRCESVLRRMPGVIDALDTVLGRLWRVRAVRIALILVILIVTGVAADYPEVWSGALML